MEKLLLLFLLLISLAVSGEAQGYVVQPLDSMVLPLGVEGTDYADVVPGIRGGTLHLAVIEDPGGWNHYASNETNTTAFTNRMFSGLLNLHPLTGELVPDMASSYEVSKNERVITFHLRRDIRWSDGVLFTAEDVLFTFESILNVNNDLPMVCEKTDPYTVTFTLDTPWRPILNNLSFAIMPKHACSLSILSTVQSRGDDRRFL